MGRVIPRMSELAYVETPMGDLLLRRRFDPAAQCDVYEVKLGDEFLMSSLFTVAEEELARLGLAALSGDEPLDVVVGGLGLGYTAVTALDDARIRSLIVIDALPPVIDWHKRRLLPVSERLVGDTRTRLVAADFFAWARGEQPAGTPSAPVDAILLDVDHTPQHTLDASHGGLYTVAGFARLAERLRPGGVFALWSDEAPHPATLEHLRAVFDDVAGHTVAFANLLTGGESVNGVYVARARSR